MAQTYIQIQRQIEALEKQAEKLKATEVKGVVERIKVAIEHYGLTAEQLGLAGGKASTAKAAKKTTKKSGGAVKSAAAYADDNGNVWGGRGPRPRWLRDAIAAGKSLEEFATSAPSTKKAAGAAKKIASKSKGKRQAKASYRNDSGNSWSGFGPKPRWLREQLEAGKALEEFATSPSKN